MTERKNAKAMAGGSLQSRMQAGLDLPLQGRLRLYIKSYIIHILYIYIYTLIAVSNRLSIVLFYIYPNYNKLAPIA